MLRHVEVPGTSLRQHSTGGAGPVSSQCPWWKLSQLYCIYNTTDYNNCIDSSMIVLYCKYNNGKGGIMDSKHAIDWIQPRVFTFGMVYVLVCVISRCYYLALVDLIRKRRQKNRAGTAKNLNSMLYNK